MYSLTELLYNKSMKKYRKSFKRKFVDAFWTIVMHMFFIICSLLIGTIVLVPLLPLLAIIVMIGILCGGAWFSVLVIASSAMLVILSTIVYFAILAGMD